MSFTGCYFARSSWEKREIARGYSRTGEELHAFSQRSGIKLQGPDPNLPIYEFVPSHDDYYVLTPKQKIRFPRIPGWLFKFYVLEEQR